MEKKSFYSPMEEVLIKGAQLVSEAAPTTKELCQAALKTKEDFMKALELDALLLEMEAKANMMDGFTMEELIL